MCVGGWCVVGGAWWVVHGGWGIVGGFGVAAPRAAFTQVANYVRSQVIYKHVRPHRPALFDGLFDGLLMALKCF